MSDQNSGNGPERPMDEPMDISRVVAALQELPPEVRDRFMGDAPADAVDVLPSTIVELFGEDEEIPEAVRSLFGPDAETVPGFIADHVERVSEAQQGQTGPVSAVYSEITARERERAESKTGTGVDIREEETRAGVLHRLRTSMFGRIIGGTVATGAVLVVYGLAVGAPQGSDPGDEQKTEACVTKLVGREVDLEFDQDHGRLLVPEEVSSEIAECRDNDFDPETIASSTVTQ